MSIGGRVEAESKSQVAESRQSRFLCVDIMSQGSRVEAESIPMCGHHVPTVAESRQSQIPLVDTKFRGGRVEAESISKVAESKQSRFL